jgi:CRISPR-associated protein Cas1
VNRALSCANSCLYGVCHAAIVSAGFSPALGFIHTGKMLSFVYDIADLYKTELSVPAAFSAATEGDAQLETRVRKACRNAFYEQRLLEAGVGVFVGAVPARVRDKLWEMACTEWAAVRAC